MELFSRADRTDDAALVAGYAIGDPAASRAFVRRFQGAVYGLAVSITRDAPTAEDVAQEVFTRAWKAAGTYDVRRASVRTWLLRITRNAAIDAVRGRRSVPMDADVLDQLLGATFVHDGPEYRGIQSTERDRAVVGLRELPPDQARAVVLAVLGGCTAAEVSRHEEIPLGTAKTRIRTGLRRLRERLREDSDG